MESKPVKQAEVVCESCGFRLTVYSPLDDSCPCPDCKKKVELK